MDAQLKVLCVGDDPATRRLLELAGCDVRVCHGGPAALSEAEEFYPDVYVLDLEMPEADVDELAVLLQEQAGERPVRFVALTGLWDINAQHKTHNAGFEEHLVKPADPKRLVEAVTASRASRRTSAVAGTAWGDMTGLMRRHPFGTLLVGIGIGFLLSRLLYAPDVFSKLHS